MAKIHQQPAPQPNGSICDGGPGHDPIVCDPALPDADTVVALAGYLDDDDTMKVRRLYGDAEWSGGYFEIASSDIVGTPRKGHPDQPADVTIVLVRRDAIVMVCEPAEAWSLEDGIATGRWPRRLQATSTIIAFAFSDPAAALDAQPR